MHRFVIISAFVLGSLFVQNTSEAGLSHSLGLNNQSHKASRQLAKGQRKAFKHGRKGGGHIPPGTVSPCTTLLAQILCSQEDLFILIHDAYDLNLIGRHKTKHFVRKVVKLDFRVVGRSGRREFKQYNNGAKKRQVRKEYLAFMFRGGVLPLYY